ncbi:MAG: flagellar assembly protein FliW [Rhizobiales bacterium]|nr:flagellar assembly protein FliW [Hyphomicrobiales bacterium]
MNQPVATEAARDPHAPSAAGKPAVIQTRFGDLTIDPDKIIAFERGIYGFEHHRHFLLSQVPAWPGLFSLLQALDDPGLSLIVLPLEGGDGLVDPADFRQACRTHGYDPEATIVIGIVTMREDQGGQIFTVNLKAPLLIDSRRRSGRQHVFASDRYPLRHPLQASGTEG